MSTPTVVITFMNGPADGSWATLHGDLVSIGRDGDNDVVIGFDPRVTARHLEIRRGDGGWRVVDVSGGAGVLQGGAPVDGEQPLRPGQLLQLGDTQLQVTVSPASAAAQQPDAER